MELTRKAGNTKKVSSQYLQISSTQKIVCLGLKTKLTAPEGYIVNDCGTLSLHSSIFRMQICNSLINYNWDFDKYPDPYIFLIEPIF